jgi:tetratricopeptide (TPR) repeat protein
VAVFRILSLFMLCQTFDEHAVSWLRPGAWGASPLWLAKAVNLMFVAWIALSAAATTNAPRGGRRARWAAYLAALTVLLLLQYGIARTGDLARVTYHTRHGADRRKSPAERIDHCTTAIDLFPGAPIAAEAYLERGQAHLLARDHASAVEDYSAALEAGSSSSVFSGHRRSVALLGRGIAHREMGDSLAAVEDFRTAVSLHVWWPARPSLVRRPALDMVAALLDAHAYRELGEMGDPAAVPGLVRSVEESLAAPPESESAFRTALAIRALGRIGDPRALETLARVVASAPSPEVRRAAAEAAGRLATPAAVPLLVEVMDADESLTVRCQALLSLYDTVGEGAFMPGVATIWPGPHPETPEEGIVIRGVATEREIRASAVRFIEKHPEAATEWRALRGGL